jgi:hypothetical protein
MGPLKGNQSKTTNTTKWPKENRQTDKQQSIKHTHKTKGRVTRTPLNKRIRRVSLLDKFLNKTCKICFVTEQKNRLIFSTSLSYGTISDQHVVP